MFYNLKTFFKHSICFGLIFFAFSPIVYAKNQIHKTFVMPSIQLSSLSHFKNSTHDAQPFSLMGIVLATHHHNYKWSGSVLTLMQLEKASSDIDYDYNLFQGSLNYQIKKNIKLQISTGPFNYKDRINNVNLSSFFVKSTCQYYFSPTRYIQLGIKNNQLDYNNNTSKQKKLEYSLSLYPYQQSFISPYLGVGVTDSDSSNSNKLFMGIHSYFSNKQSLALRLSHTNTSYSQSSAKKNHLSVSYTYSLTPVSSLIVNQDLSIMDNDKRYTFSIGYSYFGSFNKNFKKEYKNTLSLLLNESRQAIQNKNYEKAKNILQIALYRYPQDVTSRMQLAFVYHHLKQESLSNNVLAQVLNIYPDRLDALYLKARNHINLSNFTEALSLLNYIYQQTQDTEIKQLIMGLNKNQINKEAP